MEHEKSREKIYQKFEYGVIPIGRQPVEFYAGIVYKELFRKTEIKLVSRGDYGIRKILTIVTDLLSSDLVELNNNQIIIDFKSAVNDRKQSVMLPCVEVTLKQKIRG